jgi:hypothetical protein
VDLGVKIAPYPLTSGNIYSLATDLTIFSAVGVLDADEGGPWGDAGRVHGAGPCPGLSQIREVGSLDNQACDQADAWVTWSDNAIP